MEQEKFSTWIRVEVLWNLFVIFRNKIAFHQIIRSIYQPVTLYNFCVIGSFWKYWSDIYRAIAHFVLLNLKLSRLLLRIVNVKEVYARHRFGTVSLSCPLLGVFKSSLNINLCHVFIPISWNLVRANIKGCYKPRCFVSFYSNDNSNSSS